MPKGIVTHPRYLYLRLYRSSVGVAVVHGGQSSLAASVECQRADQKMQHPNCPTAQ